VEVQRQPTHSALFGNYVFYPTFPNFLSDLFLDTVNSVLDANLKTLAPSNYPRSDIVAAYLTGIPNLNMFPGTNPPGEMLRLNTSIPPTSADKQNRYGVLAGDAAGFPNGRRPGDDIVDLTVQVFMGALCYVKNNPWCTKAQAPVGYVLFTDGAPQLASEFNVTWPYLLTPVPGYRVGQAITSLSGASSLKVPFFVSLIMSFWN